MLMSIYRLVFSAREDVAGLLLGFADELATVGVGREGTFVIGEGSIIRIPPPAPIPPLAPCVPPGGGRFAFWPRAMVSDITAPH